jgi:hypothetical protein
VPYGKNRVEIQSDRVRDSSGKKAFKRRPAPPQIHPERKRRALKAKGARPQTVSAPPAKFRIEMR